jgi:YHS domain-containing protein
MRKMTLLSVMVATALCLSIGAKAADDAPKLKCPVSGKFVNKDHGAAYKDGQVYFCCENCPKAFQADTQKYASKANAQLVATGQYKEVKCPLTGQALNPKTATKIGGVSVAFCCNGCKGKVAKAKKGDKLDLVFSDAAFAKGFEKVVAADKK